MSASSFRKIWWIPAILLAFGVAALVALHLMLDRALLEDVINGALTSATDGLYYVEIDDLSFSVLGGNVKVSNLNLHRHEEIARRLKARGRASSVQVTGQLDEVSIEGVALFRLALWRELVADRFSVTRPRIRMSIVERLTVAEMGAREEMIARDDSTLLDDLQSVEQTLLSGVVPYLAIKDVEIADVNATLVAIGPYGVDKRETDLTNRIEGLSFRMKNLIIDPEVPRDPDRTAFSDDFRIDFNHLRVELPGESTLDVGPLSTSSREERVDIGGVSVVPSYTEEEFLDGAGPPGDRVEISVGPISFTRLKYRRLMSDLDFRLAHGRVENLDVRILSDKHRTRPNTTLAKTPQFMPHNMFNDIPARVSVDTLELVTSSIKYSERSTKAMNAGSITFEDLSATIQNVSNDPELMTPETPARIDATAKLFGVAPAFVRLDVPLLSPAPTMTLKARVGSFDPQEVNAILPALEGMRVTGGHVDSAWLEIEYGPAMATGSLIAIYRDLGVRLEDRDTGEQNLGQKILSFGAKIGLRGGNDPKPNEAPKAGKVEYEIDLEKPFFQIFWEAIRQGLLDLVMKI